MQSVAVLGDRTPLRGQYAGLRSARRPAEDASSSGRASRAGRSGEALLAARRADVAVLAKVGERARPCGQISDLFTAADDLARPGSDPDRRVPDRARGRGAVGRHRPLERGRVARGRVRGEEGARRGQVPHVRHAAAGSGGRFAFDGARRRPERTLFRARGRTSERARGERSRHGRASREPSAASTRPPRAAAAVAFRALLDHGREGIFVARGRCTMAIAGAATPSPAAVGSGASGRRRSRAAPSSSARPR
jgi:hypothetical protein